MYDRNSFFGIPIKTLGSLGKIRVGRVTGNTHIFFGLITEFTTYFLYTAVLENIDYFTWKCSATEQRSKQNPRFAHYMY